MALKTTRRAFIAAGAATIALSYHDRGGRRPGHPSRSKSFAPILPADLRTRLRASTAITCPRNSASR